MATFFYRFSQIFDQIDVEIEIEKKIDRILIHFDQFSTRMTEFQLK